MRAGRSSHIKRRSRQLGFAKCWEMQDECLGVQQRCEEVQQMCKGVQQTIELGGTGLELDRSGRTIEWRGEESCEVLRAEKCKSLDKELGKRRGRGEERRGRE
jgi:hypothetical protein